MFDYLVALDLPATIFIGSLFVVLTYRLVRGFENQKLRTDLVALIHRAAYRSHLSRLAAINLLDIFFGRRHFTWRCASRSVIVSVFSLAICMFLFLDESDFEKISRDPAGAGSVVQYASESCRESVGSLTSLIQKLPRYGVNGLGYDELLVGLSRSAMIMTDIIYSGRSAYPLSIRGELSEGAEKIEGALERLASFESRDVLGPGLKHAEIQQASRVLIALRDCNEFITALAAQRDSGKRFFYYEAIFLLVIGFVINLVADFFSIAESRLVITRMGQTSPAVYWLTVDVFLTVIIFIAGFSFMLWLASVWVFPFANIATIYKVYIESKLIVPLFASTFATTAWVLLFFVSIHMSRIESPLAQLLRVILRYQDIEKDPLKYITMVFALVFVFSLMIVSIFT